MLKHLRKIIIRQVMEDAELQIERKGLFNH